MAKAFTPVDVYAVMNALVKQATGSTNLTVVDSSTFISAGERVLATGTENVLNSLGIVLGRTFMSVRPYQAKLAIINAINSGAYTNRMRKISFYAKDNQAAGDVNTNLYTNLKTGFDNGSNSGSSVGTMWEQNLPVALEMNFAGTDVWDKSVTILEYQLKIAFRSEAEFGEFVSGIMTEAANDIESTKEAFNRMILLNKIAGTYAMSASMPGSVVNLTAAYNTRFGTNYTSEQLRTTYLEEFLKFFVAQFKLASDYMTNRSAKYHWSPAKTVDSVNYTLLRHTPKDKQRAILYAPLFTEARANVYPDIFNPQYLDINNYEGVTYWQSFNSPASIDVIAAIPDTTSPTGAQKATSEIQIPYVVGMLYDVDGMMVDYQLESADSTPVEARKKFRNLWWHFHKNGVVDQTENTIIFIMQD